MPADPTRSTAARMAMLLALLAAAWLLWSGLYKPLLLGLGVLSCLLTLKLTRRMGYFDNDMFAVQLNLRLLGYLVWLTREIMRSSMEVARVVLDPKLPISPQFVEIKATATDPFDLTILGNSITLTPGTLALDVHEGVLKVHTLTREGADELMTGEMDRRVAALRDG